ncbi:MAG: VOC family protein [Steroidobacteraceae bacterium]
MAAEDFDAAVGRAAELKAAVISPRHRNPPDGDGGPNHWEIWLRDPDGYSICSPVQAARLMEIGNQVIHKR